MLEIWSQAVVDLGGDERVARDAGAELLIRYRDARRRYHDEAHLLAVLRDSALLAEELELPGTERALLTLAAAAHDVVYDGQPGEDERRSANWATDWLDRAGLPGVLVDRVAELVLATLDHTAAADDLTALALLDADLAVLGADEADYERYRTAVRAEYAEHPEPAWRKGGAAVLADLLARTPLYATEAARARWETAAKANLARELATLT